MSQRRSQLEISLKILDSVRNGLEKPTRIMYASNMSWSRATKTMCSLVEQGLVAEVIETRRGVKSRRRYKITEKGVSVLDYFDEGRKILQIN